MKKLFIILFAIACSFYSMAQFPQQQSLGAPNTRVYSKGGLGSDSGFIFQTNFPDTTAANKGFLKNIPGIMIRVADTVYLRNTTATKWNQIETGSSLFANGITKIG